MIASHQALLDLRHKLMAAKGSDWDLDKVIQRTLTPIDRKSVPPPFTRSSDVARQLLPGDRAHTFSNEIPGVRGQAFLWSGHYKNAQNLVCAFAATPALAIILARVEYEIAKAEGDTSSKSNEAKE